MHVGVQMVFQAYGSPNGTTDAQVYEEELHLADLAEPLGFDSIWPVEHHFTDYALCPDNTLFLAHMAGRTTRLRLATGAVILPWNQPLRVAERVAMLDQLSGGRVLFGIGRGLARAEYEQFGIAMDESRRRFDEAAPMVLDALETGWIEGRGPFYRQPRAPIRPSPTRSFRDRTYCVAMSPDSVEAAADLGARMIVFSQRSWPDQAQAYEEYRERYVGRHGGRPGPLLTCDFVYCDRDPTRAEEMGRQHIAGYLRSVMEHYELFGDHFAAASGYESYATAVEVMRAIGLERLCERYLDVQAWGTPRQVLERLRERRTVVGQFDLTCCFRFAGLPLGDAEASMRTFAGDVLPTLRNDPAFA